MLLSFAMNRIISLAESSASQNENNENGRVSLVFSIMLNSISNFRLARFYDFLAAILRQLDQTFLA